MVDAMNDKTGELVGELYQRAAEQMFALEDVVNGLGAPDGVPEMPLDEAQRKLQRIAVELLKSVGVRGAGLLAEHPDICRVVQVTNPHGTRAFAVVFDGYYTDGAGDAEHIGRMWAEGAGLPFGWKP